MKLAFFSNFLNHHQLPLCLEFYNNPDVDFVFVACEKTPYDRLDMGYADMNTQYPFVVKAYENEANALDIAKNYDVVIFGASPLKYLNLRMKENKLSFRFCERSLKKGTWRRFIPRTRKKIHNEYVRYKNKNLYILCASAYTAYDLKLCGFPKEKCFQWGYFPEIEEKNLDDVFRIKADNSVPEILYAGRLLELKHVMDTVKAVHKLSEKGLELHFTIIGEGETEQGIKDYIKANKLENQITVLPFVSHEKVRDYMDKADIYVFGSNFYEGWGAVVNEAMNSACAVIASHSVGSTAYLIKHKENGYIYKFADVEQLSDCLSELVNSSDLRRKVGENAYNTVKNMWSAKNATDRFYKLWEALVNEEDSTKLFENGPCAPAPIYNNHWFKG